ncbi:nitric oxide reductase activation protein NorD [Nocardia carnea]|uniref:nitric oxide reductase activation protein NorD n=1 Tax=Nocardia carnea TaxID=37328 RepID=UPI002456CCE0|nr:VWA domain-containing protein [Nocardia carnea]
MTATEVQGPQRFRLLATFLAGRSVAVAAAPTGQASYTDGDAVFVSAGRSHAHQRSEVVVQCALLRAGSLDPLVVRRLRGRPHVARRYLALEGRRGLAELARHVPLAAALAPYGEAMTATTGESLTLARGKAVIADPPEWFGVIEPARLLKSGSGPSARATDKDLRAAFDLPDRPEPEDDEEDNDPEGNGTSRILKLFENPMVNSERLADLLRKLLGTSRASGDSDAGAQMRAGAVRRGRTAGGDARPLPTPITFVVDGKPGAVTGIGGAWYPEWDVHGNRYRPEWCRVLDFPLTTDADTSAAAIPHDHVLRRRLARVGLGPKVLRRRPDGDELDIDALLDLVVDIRSGYSRAENIYAETRTSARNLGVLILFDTSGSATDTDPDGLAVHEHHRRAAATLAATLEELGDRVAVYAFRSDSRHAVHLAAIKTFGRRFGAVERARLAQLEPSGYTRLGAGIRGAGRILDTEAGTPYRLLLVLTDALPYDHGYESRYAEADTRKAVDELRAEGIASLCLTIGAATTTDTLERVFGPGGYAEAATLSGLSPQMDELFSAALRELSAPKPRGR